MRIALVLPSRLDPAHRRVRRCLERELTRAGDEVRCFYPRSRASAAALERVLWKSRPEVCHIQYFSRGLGCLGAVRFPPKTTLILTHQGASFELMDDLKSFRRLARRADFLTSVSREGLKEMLAALPGEKAKVRWIANGADFEKSRRPSGAKPFGRPFALSVARLAAYKGTDILLMAFALAADQGFDLALCGPDQTGGRLARFAARLGLKGRVHFLGKAAPARVSRLLEQCLFFVLPSRRENMPMALLEAMAAGKAAVASSAGGVPEVIAHGKNGLLIEPENVRALAAAMKRLARNAGLRRRLGRSAISRALRFKWPAVAAQYRALYARGR